MARRGIAVLVVAALAGCGGGDDEAAAPTPTASATTTATPTGTATPAASAFPTPSATAPPAELARFRREVEAICAEAKPRLQAIGFRVGQRAARQGLSDEQAQARVLAAAIAPTRDLLDELRREVDPPAAERVPFEAFLDRIADTFPLLRRLSVKIDAGETDDRETRAIAAQLGAIAIDTRGWTARVDVPTCNPS